MTRVFNPDRELLSNAERLLWGALRARRLGGWKFVRQEPIGPFIADFVCRESKLVIEIDGATHSTPEELDYDAGREAQLSALGYEVPRFNNQDIYANPTGVLETILTVLQARPQIPSPLRGEG
jgi:very-short-patch-repair endonuclease